MKRGTTDTSGAHWKVTAIMALIAAAIFFWPFFGAICFAVVSAYLFYPLHRWFSRALPQGVSVWVTVLSAIAIVVLPVVLTLMVAVAQGVSFANSVAVGLEASTPDQIRDEVEQTLNQVNAIVAPLSAGQVQLTLESVQEFFATTVPSLLKALLAVALDFASSLPALFTAATVYVFLFAALLARGGRVLNDIKSASPFTPELADLYVVRIGAMIRASMVSQLLMAFILALLTTLTLLIIGAGPYFLFLLVSITLLNMVPLGSGILVVPLSIGAMLLGDVSGGLWVLAIYLVVICNIDNIMRPRLIPKSVRLDPALMLLALFCGLYYFGILGLVYGPIVAIVLLTTFEVYVEYKRGVTKPRKKGVAV